MLNVSGVIHTEAFFRKRINRRLNARVEHHPLEVHANLFEDPSGSAMLRPGNRDSRIEVKLLESVPQTSARRFGGESHTPKLLCQHVKQLRRAVSGSPTT